MVTRSRHLAKKTVLPLLDRAGAFRLARHLDSQRRRAVLNYHSVDPAAFRRHASFLAANARVVDLEDLLSSAATSNLEVALTFDDGYATFMADVLPVLKEFDFPCTWFVPTAHVGTREIFWFDRVRAAVMGTPRTRVASLGREWPIHDWNRGYVASAVTRGLKMLPPGERHPAVEEVLRDFGAPELAAVARFESVTVDQLRSLPPRVAIGSHSHTHPQLCQLPDESLREELTISRQHLEAWTGRPVVHFAYPSGDYDDRVRAALRAAGYRSAWTTEPRFFPEHVDELRYSLPRILVDDHEAVGVLSAKLTFWVNRLEGSPA